MPKVTFLNFFTSNYKLLIQIIGTYGAPNVRLADHFNDFDFYWVPHTFGLVPHS